MPIFFLSDRIEFPDVSKANQDGLLAVGGDLSPERLILAYKSGIFPWFNDDALLLWWSPDPRMVLFPKNIKISKTMKSVLAKNEFSLTRNSCFKQVVEECAKIERKGQMGTWITPKMKSAYLKLHEMGFAMSYEVWQANELVGGLYGIDLGTVFCGESMFSKTSNASKFALINLANELREKNYGLIDCQVPTEHLESLGAEKMPRDKFMALLNRLLQGGQ